MQQALSEEKHGERRGAEQDYDDKRLRKYAGYSRFDLIVMGVVAMAFAYGTKYVATGAEGLGFGLFVDAILYWGFFLALLWMLRILVQWLGKPAGATASKIMEMLVPSGNKRASAVLRIAIVAFVCWLPAIIMLYPGSLNNDTWGQLFFYYYMRVGGTITAHHPVFDTMLFGLFFDAMNNLTGSWQVGFFLFVCLQAALMAVGVSRAVLLVKRLTPSSGIRWALFVLALLCFNPLLPVMVSTISKDSVFSVFFLLFLTDFLDLAFGQYEIVGKRHAVRLGVFAAFCCLTKSLGPYIMLPSLLVLFLLRRKGGRREIIPLVIALMTVLVVMPFLKIAYRAEDGGMQEMLSLPFQMSARYAVEHGDDVTVEEREVLSKVLEYDTITEDYNPRFADPVKGYAPRGERDDYMRYLAVWFKQGLRHPDSYLRAIASQVSACFAWEEIDPIYDMSWHSQLRPEIFEESVTVRSHPFYETAKFMRERVRTLWGIPFVGMLVSYGFYITVVPVVCLLQLMRMGYGWRRAFIALAPILLSVILGIWLAPVVTGIEGSRYVIPLLWTAPMLLALASVPKQGESAAEPGELEESA